MRKVKLGGREILERELKGCYNFFIKEANNNKKSKGYGLIRDKSEIAPEVASVASVGYGLAAIVIGTERKWIKYNKAYEKINKTLDTFLYNMHSENGFFFHFVNMETAEREWNSEISIIDTAIFICGALLAGEYFGKDIKKKASKLYEQINWKWYLDEKTNQFYMGYSKENGFWGHWDMYAEQLMLYVLCVASPTYPVDERVYDFVKKEKKDYLNIKDIIYTYCGTLFTYQYSHAWIDFRGLKDKDGIDWFYNSTKATLANREYCIRNSDKFKTFNEKSWGLTACVCPRGYSGGFGAMPADSNLNIENDGTIAPCGAIGSIVFTPLYSLQAVEYYYNNFPDFWCKYGFKDAYNLEMDKPWFSKECIGIDKGISMLMIENYFTGLIWKHFMKNVYVERGMGILGFSKSKKELGRTR